jgi:CRP-like cAMP-binding protein
MQSSTDLRRILSTDIWFSQVPAGLADALLAHARIKSLPQGQALFRRGEAVDGLYAVLTGALTISGVTREGREAVLSLVEPPMWFGEIALFDRMPRTHDAVAVTESTLLFIPLADMDALLEQNPLLWRHFGVMMAFKVRLAFIALEDLAIVQPPQRVARRLVWLSYCAAHGDQSDRCRLTIKQSQLALMTSLSRQTVNQLLRALEERGVIRLAYGLIDVCDMPALMAEAALSPVERRIVERTGPLPHRAC